MDAIEPHRSILLTTDSRFPGQISACAYALACELKPAVVPDEVRVVATGPGAEAVRAAGFERATGPLGRLQADYGLTGASEAQLHVLLDAAGKPLESIDRVDDDKRLADQLLALVGRLTADPATMLHVAIVDGHQVFGLYLAHALALLGRQQDRLYHVMIPEVYASDPHFYYPKAPGDVLPKRVAVAEIPFVRLREDLPRRLLAQPGGLAEAVAVAQHAREQPHLTIDLAGRRLIAGSEAIALEPAPLAYYSMMARRRQKGMHPARWDTDGIDRQFLAEYRRIVGAQSDELERVEAALEVGMSCEYFDEQRSRVNRALEEALGPRLATAYVVAGDDRPEPRYSVAIEATSIDYAPATTTSEDSPA